MDAITWSQSGLFEATLRDALKNTLALDLTSATHKLALLNNSEVPDYSGTHDPATWSGTNEVYGSGWAQGGVALSAAAAGPASVVPTVTLSTNKVVWDFTNDVSVVSTTLSNAYGAYIYADALADQDIIGIFFGGSPYSTVAGTFAITINVAGLATIACYT